FVRRGRGVGRDGHLAVEHVEPELLLPAHERAEFALEGGHLLGAVHPVDAELERRCSPSRHGGVPYRIREQPGALGTGGVWPEASCSACTRRLAGVTSCPSSRRRRLVAAPCRTWPCTRPRTSP